jgi:hypothetical protein
LSLLARLAVTTVSCLPSDLDPARDRREMVS